MEYSVGIMYVKLSYLKNAGVRVYVSVSDIKDTYVSLADTYTSYKCHLETQVFVA